MAGRLAVQLQFVVRHHSHDVELLVLELRELERLAGQLVELGSGLQTSERGGAVAGWHGPLPLLHVPDLPLDVGL